MPDRLAVTETVLLSAAITWALRAMPFAALAPLRGSATVRYLGVHMPLGVMVLLALYTLRNAHLTHAPGAIAFPVAVVTTLGLHLRWRNALLSILGGTLVHVILATLVHP